MWCILDTTVRVTVTKCTVISITIDTIFVYINILIVRLDYEPSLGSIEVTSNGWFAKCVLVVIEDGEDIMLHTVS